LLTFNQVSNLFANQSWSSSSHRRDQIIGVAKRRVKPITFRLSHIRLKHPSDLWVKFQYL